MASRVFKSHILMSASKQSRRTNAFETTLLSAVEGTNRPPRDNKLMKPSSLHPPVSWSLQQALVSGFIFLATYTATKLETSQVCSFNMKSFVLVTDIFASVSARAIFLSSSCYSVHSIFQVTIRFL